MKDRLRRGFLIGSFMLLAVFVISAGSWFRWLDYYELGTLDLRFRLRPFRPVTDQIVFIEISDDSIRQFGEFPFDRSHHAVLINALHQFGARAILFDIFFSEQQLSDTEFEEAIRLAGNVYLPHVLKIEQQKRGELVSAKGYAARSLQYFTDAAKGNGHINIIPDPDGKFRRVPLLIKDADGTLHPYLSFLLSAQELNLPLDKMTIHPGHALQWGSKVRIPMDERSSMIINYSGKWGDAYSHYSYVDVLRSFMARYTGEVPVMELNVFKDKVCLVGLTAEGTVDLHPNPFEPIYPSVGIHAEVFNSIINRTFITRAAKEVNLIVVILLVLLTSLMISRVKPWLAFCIIVAVNMIFAGIAIMVFNVSGFWLDLFFPVVAVVVTYLVATVWKYILEWNRRALLENELQIASTIQQSFLPKEVPRLDGLDVAVSMLTARQVGGDLYDFLSFNEDQLGVMIGDVTGKGIPASLFMAMVVGAFKFYAKADVPANETLHLLNDKLILETSENNLFVTMYYAVFNFKHRVMSYASGGHLPALYAPRDHSMEFLDAEDGLPLGMINRPYSGHQVDFQQGDVFVFYTDGITEARNSKSEFYGAQRLEQLVYLHRARCAAEIARIIEDDVRAFEPRSRQQDDVTFIVIKIG